MTPAVRRDDPPYLQVARHIRSQIESGELQIGDRVPSEREIVEQWRISRATATKVLATLRADGLVESRSGSGTIVRSTNGMDDFALECFEAREVAITHGPCRSSASVKTLRQATSWAIAHRCI